MVKALKGSTKTLIVTGSGKITLTKDLLDHMGVSLGERIDVVLSPNGELRFEAAQRSVDNGDAVLVRRN